MARHRYASSLLLAMILVTPAGCPFTDDSPPPRVEQFASTVNDPLQCERNVPLIEQLMVDSEDCSACLQDADPLRCVLKATEPAYGYCPSGTVCDPMRGFRCSGTAGLSNTDPCPVGYVESPPDSNECRRVTPLGCTYDGDCPVGMYCDAGTSICKADCVHRDETSVCAESGASVKPGCCGTTEVCGCDGRCYESTPPSELPAAPDRRPVLAVAQSRLTFTKSPPDPLDGTRALNSQALNVTVRNWTDNTPDNGSLDDLTVTVTASRGFAVYCPPTADESKPTVFAGNFVQECAVTYTDSGADTHRVWVAPADLDGDLEGAEIPTAGQVRFQFYNTDDSLRRFPVRALTPVHLIEPAVEELIDNGFGCARGVATLIELGSTRGEVYSRPFGDGGTTSGKFAVPIRLEGEIGAIDVPGYSGQAVTITLIDSTRTITPNGKVRVQYRLDLNNPPVDPADVVVEGPYPMLGSEGDLQDGRPFLTYEGIRDLRVDQPIHLDLERRQLTGVFGLRIKGLLRSEGDAPDPVVAWRWTVDAVTKCEGAPTNMPPAVSNPPTADSMRFPWLEAIRDAALPKAEEWQEWLESANSGSVVGCALSTVPDTTPHAVMCKYIASQLGMTSSVDEFCTQLEVATAGHFGDVPGAADTFFYTNVPCIAESDSPYACGPSCDGQNTVSVEFGVSSVAVGHCSITGPDSGLSSNGNTDSFALDCAEKIFAFSPQVSLAESAHMRRTSDLLPVSKEVRLVDSNGDTIIPGGAGFLHLADRNEVDTNFQPLTAGGLLEACKADVEALPGVSYGDVEQRLHSVFSSQGCISQAAWRGSLALLTRLSGDSAGSERFARRLAQWTHLFGFLAGEYSASLSAMYGEEPLTQDASSVDSLHSWIRLGRRVGTGLLLQPHIYAASAALPSAARARGLSQGQEGGLIGGLDREVRQYLRAESERRQWWGRHEQRSGASTGFGGATSESFSGLGRRADSFVENMVVGAGMSPRAGLGADRTNRGPSGLGGGTLFDEVLGEQLTLDGLELDTIPVHFVDPQGANSKFFATSDYLMTQWAQPAVNQALTAYNAMRSAYFASFERQLQQQTDADEGERRLESLVANYARRYSEICGEELEVGTPSSLFDEWFAPDGPSLKECYVRDVGSLGGLDSQPENQSTVECDAVVGRLATATASQHQTPLLVEDMVEWSNPAHDPSLADVKRELCVASILESDPLLWVRLEQSDVASQPSASFKTDFAQQLESSPCNEVFVEETPTNQGLSMTYNYWVGLPLRWASPVKSRPLVEFTPSETIAYYGAEYLNQHPLAWNDSAEEWYQFRLGTPLFAETWGGRHPLSVVYHDYSPELFADVPSALQSFPLIRNLQPLFGGAKLGTPRPGDNWDATTFASHDLIGDIGLTADFSLGAVSVPSLELALAYALKNEWDPYDLAVAQVLKVPEPYTVKRGVQRALDMFHESECGQWLRDNAVWEDPYDEWPTVMSKFRTATVAAVETYRDVCSSFVTKHPTPTVPPKAPDYSEQISPTEVAACFKGELGLQHLVVYSAFHGIRRAEVEMSTLRSTHYSLGDLCLKRKGLIDEQNALSSDFERGAASMAAVQEYVGLAGNLVGNAASGAYASLISAPFEIIQAEMNKAQREAQLAFNETIRELEGQVDEISCWGEVDRYRLQFDNYAEAVKASLIAAATALTERHNLEVTLQNLRAEGWAAVQAERARQNKQDDARGGGANPSGEYIPLTNEYNVEYVDAEARYQRLFKRAKVLVWIAAKGLEHEAQVNFAALKNSVKSATSATELEQLLHQIQKEHATRTINGARPEEKTIVLSVRDDILRLRDTAEDELASGGSPSSRFGELITSELSHIYDKEGVLIGKGLYLTLEPVGALRYRCAERLWSVNATVQGDMLGSESPEVPVMLLKADTFKSQWCDGHVGDGIFQTAQLRPEVNLFMDGWESGEHQVEPTKEYSWAYMNGWINVKRKDFYADSYRNGASDELAGRGLYGNYILVLPTHGVLDSGIDLSRVEDILLRFDYVSVNNGATGVTPPHQGATVGDGLVAVGGACDLDADCENGTCTGEICCNTLCDGAYVCEPVTADCRTTCASDLHCTEGNFCDSGACVPVPAPLNHLLGSACTADADCASGHCGTVGSSLVCCATDCGQNGGLCTISGECVQPCADDSACTQPERCVAGRCYADALAVDFDGFDDALAIPTGWELPSPAPFGISAWVQVDDPTASQVIFQSSNAAGASASLTVVPPNSPQPAKLRFQVTDGTNTVVADAPALSPAAWHHVAASYGVDGVARLYVNGALADDSDANTNVSLLGHTTLRVGDGDHLSSSTDQLKGRISELSVWASDLQDEVASLASGPTDLSQLASATALLHWWRMGDGPNDTGTVIADNVGSQDLTSFNMNTTDRTARSWELPSIPLSGQGQYLVANDFELGAHNAITVEAWFKLEQHDASLMAVGSINATEEIRVRVDASGAMVTEVETGGQITTIPSTTSLPVNEWVRVSLSIDTETKTIETWLNARRASLGSVSLLPGVSKLFLGSSAGAAAADANGRLGPARVFDHVVGDYLHHVLTTSPQQSGAIAIHHWLMGAGTGDQLSGSNTTIADQAGTPVALTGHGLTAPVALGDQPDDALVDSCAVFDGASFLTSTQGADLPADWTLAAWVQVDRNGSGTFFSTSSNATNRVELSITSTGHVQASYVATGGSTILTSSRAVPHSEWLLVTLERNNATNTVDLRVNDALVASDAATTFSPTTTASTRFGADQAGADMFTGKIAEVAILAGHHGASSHAWSQRPTGWLSHDTALHVWRMGDGPYDADDVVFDGIAHLDLTATGTVPMGAADVGEPYRVRAMAFDGRTSLVASNVSLGNAFTVSTWMRATGYGNVLSFSDASGNQLVVGIDSDGLPFLREFDGADFTRAAGTMPISDTRWTLLTLSVSGSDATLYVDDAAAASLSVATVPTGATVHIGSDPGAAQPFVGLLGPAVVFSAAHSGAELLHGTNAQVGWLGLPNVAHRWLLGQHAGDLSTHVVDDVGGVPLEHQAATVAMRRFDGVDDYTSGDAYTGAGKAYEKDGDWTILMWVRADSTELSTGDVAFGITEGAGALYFPYYLLSVDSGLGNMMFTSNDQTHSHSFSIQPQSFDGRFHLVALEDSYVGTETNGDTTGQLRYQVDDGQAIADAAPYDRPVWPSFAGTEDRLTVGCRAYGHVPAVTGFWKGDVAGVAWVADTLVTNSKIDAIYAAGPAGFAAAVEAAATTGTVEMLSALGNPGPASSYGPDLVHTGSVAVTEQSEGTELVTEKPPLAQAANAVSLDAANDDMLVTQGWTGAGSWTFGTWVYTEAGSGTLVESGDGTASNRITLAVDANRQLHLSVVAGGSPVADVTSAAALPYKAWQHVAMSVDEAGDIHVYVNSDGQPVISAPLQQSITTSRLSLGGSYLGTDTLDGLLVDAAVFDGVLTAADIADWSSASASGSDWQSVGALLHWWPLDHASGSTPVSFADRVGVAHLEASAGLTVDAVADAGPTEAASMDLYGGTHLKYSGDWNGSQPFTLSTWLRWGFDQSTTMAVFDLHGDAGTDDRLTLLVNASGQLVVEVESEGSSMLSASTSALTAEAWHHVAVTFDPGASGGQAKVYVDGALAATVPGTPPTTAFQTFTLGAKADATLPFVGRLGHTAWLDAIADTATVAGLAASYSTTAPANSLHWWKATDPAAANVELEDQQGNRDLDVVAPSVSTSNVVLDAPTAQ